MSITQTQQVIETERQDSLSGSSFGGSIFLSHAKIIEYLPLFKEECVYMREARLENGILHCSFNTFDYPFSKKPTKHLTRTHALLFVTQATYLLVTVLSEHDTAWPIAKKQAISLACSEQMTFTTINLNFKQFIGNKNGINLVISMPKYRIIGSRLFGNVEFEFQQGCYGSCQGIIALDGSMKVT